ncbi:MAG: hypothetical protein RL364_1113 [Pseudomonadota bacterium]|jgi:hypothetical protein
MSDFEFHQDEAEFVSLADLLRTESPRVSWRLFGLC